jgi:hypothetical protein
MVVAGTAIRANLGVTIFAYLFTLFQVGWGVLWSIAFAGTFDATYGCDANQANCSGSPNYGFLFLLFVSFYFTQQVLQVRHFFCVLAFSSIILLFVISNLSFVF